MVRVLFITLNVFKNLNKDYVILKPKFEEGDKLKAIAIIFERMTEEIIQNFIQTRSRFVYSGSALSSGTPLKYLETNNLNKT